MDPIALVVDPNPGIARRVGEALTGTGYRVVSIRSTEQLDEALEGGDLAIGLIAASLPRASGYELSRSLGERFPAAYLILMTGGFEVFSQGRARDAGVSGHLVKPFSPGTLRQLLSTELGGLLEPSAAPGDRAAERSSGQATPDEGGVMQWPAVDVPPPPLGSQRHATLIPRDHAAPPVVLTNPEVLRPELERVVAELLPEVVQAVLRHEMVHSPRTREVVEAAVEAVLARRKSDTA
jgi:CheY-like chemotaxis protein